MLKILIPAIYVVLLACMVVLLKWEYGRSRRRDDDNDL
jgi:hypothetical protein